MLQSGAALHAELGQLRGGDAEREQPLRLGEQAALRCNAENRQQAKVDTICSQRRSTAWSCSAASSASWVATKAAIHALQTSPPGIHLRAVSHGARQAVGAAPKVQLRQRVRSVEQSSAA